MSNCPMPNRNTTSVFDTSVNNCNAREGVWRKWRIGNGLDNIVTFFVNIWQIFGICYRRLSRYWACDVVIIWHFFYIFSLHPNNHILWGKMNDKIKWKLEKQLAIERDVRQGIDTRSTHKEDIKRRRWLWWRWRKPSSSLPSLSLIWGSLLIKLLSHPKKASLWFWKGVQL